MRRTRWCDRLARAAADVCRRLERVVADGGELVRGVGVGGATYRGALGAACCSTGAGRCLAGAVFDCEGAGSGRTSNDGSGVGSSPAQAEGASARMPTRSTTAQRNARTILA